MYNKLFVLFAFIVFFFSSFSIDAQDSTAVGRDTLLPISIWPKNINKAPVRLMQLEPSGTLPALLNGKISGVSVLSKSTEPGTPGWLLVRGQHAPISRHSDIYSISPLYVIDGIPLIQNHSFAFGIKQFDFDRLGSETDITTALNINDIESVEVLRGPEDIARYGVQGVDGVVLIKTKKTVPGKYKIAVNMFGGIAMRPQNINTANGRYERDFRMPFYNSYATAQQMAAFPAYLADSSNSTYFGPANWDEVFYENAWRHSVSASISGGTERAFFRVGIGNLKEKGIMRNTDLDRYNVSANIGMIPFNNLTVTTNIQLALTDRDRNTFLRERFAEQEYIPTLLAPLSPNKDNLANYYSLLDRWSFDKNQDHFLNGIINANYNLKRWNISSSFLMSYHDNNRDLFYPSTINDGNNFASYFIGLDKRTAWKNAISFEPALGDNIKLKLTGNGNIQWDKRKYDYIKGYRGGSDFVKIIIGGSNASFEDGSIYAYKDFLNHNLIAFSANADLLIKNKYELRATVNREGSSFFQNGYWWFTSPALALGWELKDDLKLPSSVSTLKLKLSGGRNGRLFDSDNYGYGPVYTVDNGYNGAPFIPSYGSIPTLTMPFTRGYTGWGIQWAYADQADLGIEVGIKKWYLSANFYIRNDKNLLVAVPVPKEYGFATEYKNGMTVKNTGIEATIRTSVGNNNFEWTPNLLLHVNKNSITALPDGLTAINTSGRRLEVGGRVDGFWLLQNDGIYASDSEVPGAGSGQPLTYYGIAVKAGDPRWRDVNGDAKVDDDDRILSGHMNPTIAGSFNQAFRYKNWELNLLASFATGNHLINQSVANRFDFANRETAGSIEGVKEITFWTQIQDMEKYPKYNPWSLVQPYQSNQTLFLEKADYIKLRSLIVAYNLKDISWVRKANISSFKVYITANNLFTATSYSGRDPELANYMGYDDGYGVPPARNFTLGLQLEF